LKTATCPPQQPHQLHLHLHLVAADNHQIQQHHLPLQMTVLFLFLFLLLQQRIAANMAQIYFAKHKQTTKAKVTQRGTRNSGTRLKAQ